MPKKKLTYDQKSRLEKKAREDKKKRKDAAISEVEGKLEALHKLAMKSVDFTVQERERIDNARSHIASVRGGWCNRRMR